MLKDDLEGDKSLGLFWCSQRHEGWPRRELYLGEMGNEGAILMEKENSPRSPGMSMSLIPFLCF